jgi:dTDP-4-amino-4,6-dideoxygalactose transaminase
VVLSENRDHLRVNLAARGIATDIHYPVLDCDQEGWRGLPGRIGPTGLEVSRKSVRKILTLPCFPALTEEEVATVCDALSAYAS